MRNGRLILAVIAAAVIAGYVVAVIVAATGGGSSTDSDAAAPATDATAAANRPPTRPATFVPTPPPKPTTYVDACSDAVDAATAATLTLGSLLSAGVNIANSTGQVPQQPRWWDRLEVANSYRTAANRAAFAVCSKLPAVLQRSAGLDSMRLAAAELDATIATLKAMR